MSRRPFGTRRTPTPTRNNVVRKSIIFGFDTFPLVQKFLVTTASMRRPATETTDHALVVVTVVADQATTTTGKGVSATT